MTTVQRPGHGAEDLLQLSDLVVCSQSPVGRRDHGGRARRERSAAQIELDFSTELRHYLRERTLDESVEAMDASTAHLRGTKPSGDEADIDVPRELIDSWRLSTGKDVLVFRYLAGRSAVLDMLPASPQSEIDPQVRHDEAFARVHARAAG